MRSRKRQNKRGAARVSSSAVSYRGSVTLPRVSEADDTIMSNFITDGVVASDVTGVIAAVFQTPDLTSNPQFLAQFPLYNEFRILAMSVQFVPNAENSVVSAVDYRPLYEVDFRENNLPLTSYAQASGFASMRSHSVNRKFSSALHMSGVAEAKWLSSPLAGPTSFGVKWYADSLTAATPYGRYRQVFLVQFRNRAD